VKFLLKTIRKGSQRFSNVKKNQNIKPFLIPSDVFSGPDFSRWHTSLLNCKPFEKVIRAARMTEHQTAFKMKFWRVKRANRRISAWCQSLNRNFMQ